MKKHLKHVQSNKDKKKRKKKTHQYCLHSLVQNDILWEREQPPFNYDKSDTKRLREINLKAHKELTLVPTYFSSHPHSQSES